MFEEVEAPIWERYADQGKIRYSLNMEHPLIQSLSSGLEDGTLNKVKILLDAISSSLPIEMIYSDFSTHPREIKQTQIAEDTVIDRLKSLKDTLFDVGEVDADAFRDVLRSTRLFESHMEIVEKFIREEFA